MRNLLAVAIAFALGLALVLCVCTGLPFVFLGLADEKSGIPSAVSPGLLLLQLAGSTAALVPVGMAAGLIAADGSERKCALAAGALSMLVPVGLMALWWSDSGFIGAGVEAPYLLSSLAGMGVGSWLGGGIVESLLKRVEERAEHQ